LTPAVWSARVVIRNWFCWRWMMLALIRKGLIRFAWYLLVA
jgi:hypothetical protein